MKNRTYSRLLMAPLLALLAVACSPNQFNQTNEYDDVYFTSSDRSAQAISKTKTQQALLNQQQKQVTVDNYSTETVDAQLLNKYNNGQPKQVTYFEDGPLVTSAQELNFDDFVADYENEQLAYYQLPLDWTQDWSRLSFNQLMQDDFHFQLAWYDQYYLGKNFRMTQYMSGRSSRFRSRGISSFGRPLVGVGFGFNNSFLGFNNMAFVDLNPWGGYYNAFWRPRRGFGFGWNNSFNDPFYCPPFYNTYNNWGWRNGWRNNVFVNNNIYIDRRADRIIAANNSRSRNVSRGPRVGTSRVATVRNEAVNGSAPATRSSRYADNLSNENRSSSSTVAGTSRGRASLNNGNTRSSSRSTTASGNSSSRSSRARTDAYRFNNNGSSRSSRSSAVRNNGSGTSRSSTGTSRAGSSRSSRSSTAGSSSSRSRSNPSFSRSSSRSRSSSARSSSSRSSSARSSSSRSSSARGSSSRSSSRSSGSASRGSSRSSSSRSSGASRSSSSSSSRSSGSSRSSSSSSRSGSSSSRSSRGN